MGSTAIVEQLWSKAGYVFTERRAGLSPLVLEMIIFLKENDDLWSIVDVVKNIIVVTFGENEPLKRSSRTRQYRPQKMRRPIR